MEIYSKRIWKSSWTEMQKGEDERKLPKTSIDLNQARKLKDMQSIPGKEGCKG